MKGRTTGFLAAMVLFLGSVLYILDHQDRMGQPGTFDSRVFDLTTAPVTIVGMIRDESRCEVTRKGEKWFIAAPIRARASGPILNRIVAAIERLRALDIITKEQRALRNLSLADYGLDPAALSVYVESGDRREQLLIGNRTPFGGGVYACKRLSDTVLIVPESFVALFPEDMHALRDQSLFQGAASRVVRIDIQRREAGFLQLVRRQNRWFVQQPVEWPADPSVVEDLLEAFVQARIQQFLWDAPVQELAQEQGVAFRSEWEDGSLAVDQAAARLTLWWNGENAGQDVFLGRRLEDAAQEVYARRGGISSVFTVSDRLLQWADISVDAIRERQIWDMPLQDVSKIRMAKGEHRIELVQQGDTGWHLQEPIRTPADPKAVSRLWQACRRLRVQSFEGPSQPEGEDPLQVEVWDQEATAEPNGAPSRSLQLEAHVGTNALWNGWMPDMERGVVLEGFEVGMESDALLWPAAYRSRRVLELDRPAIVHMLRQDGAGSVAVEKQTTPDGSAVWSCREATGGTLATNRIFDILDCISQLYADQVVAFHPAALDAFGLDAPLVTITFRSSDTDHIQQTLLLGAPIDEGRGGFAMLQGHGFVFQLQQADYEVLTDPWLLPDTQAATGGVSGAKQPPVPFKEQ